MKLFIITLTLFIMNQAFSADICYFQETWEFKEALEKKGNNSYKISSNHKRFTFIEKEMIHLTISLQKLMRGISRDQALTEFGDYFKGQQGSNAGEIIYYTLKGKRYAMVHYWPGDNEYGAFYELSSKAYKLIAVITDSFIECRQWP